MAIPGYPTATNYAPNFSRRELDCKCGCTTPAGVAINLANLAEQLEALRAKINAPLTVTSGYRCPLHNKAIGGSADSQHIHGLAADLWSRGATPARIARAAESIPLFAAGGIGRYRAWTHVDMRRSGPARW